MRADHENVRLKTRNVEAFCVPVVSAISVMSLIQRRATEKSSLLRPRRARSGGSDQRLSAPAGESLHWPRSRWGVRSRFASFSEFGFDTDADIALSAFLDRWPGQAGAGIIFLPCKRFENPKYLVQVFGSIPIPLSGRRCG